MHLVVKVLHGNPLETLGGVFGLLSAQHKFNKQLLKLLVAVIDAKLLKTTTNRIEIY